MERERMSFTFCWPGFKLWLWDSLLYWPLVSIYEPQFSQKIKITWPTLTVAEKIQLDNISYLGIRTKGWKLDGELERAKRMYMCTLGVRKMREGFLTVPIFSMTWAEAISWKWRGLRVGVESLGKSNKKTLSWDMGTHAYLEQQNCLFR